MAELRKEPLVIQWIQKRGGLAPFPDKWTVEFWRRWAEGQKCPREISMFMAIYEEILHDDTRPRDLSFEVNFINVFTAAEQNAMERPLLKCPPAPTKEFPKEGAFSRHALAGSLPEGKKIFFDSDEEEAV